MVDKQSAEEIFDLLYLKMLNFLSFRQRSDREVQDRLRKYLSRSHLPLRERDAIGDRVVLRLEESGYLSDSNDLKFSQSYVLGLSNSGKSLNQKKIHQFLFKKGVDTDVVERALEDVSKDQFLNSALKDAEKKLRQLGGLDLFQKKMKLKDFLYRKGYDGETISSVVDTLL